MFLKSSSAATRGVCSGLWVEFLGNLDDARDATQDVFLKAFENISKL